ncbi:hypothetical protein BJ875DRAFT_521097 [Amylocarpus encephaloides]|uniref:Uncharacterized protein n=1 Tax=Amylocarpus encephaloides TaxID=45428 RepID=A0A9P7YPB2_9HELO|nr:hypothetical protein BJ875DRAFT_521097 [Amylocarpus encephaloides]
MERIIAEGRVILITTSPWSIPNLWHSPPYKNPPSSLPLSSKFFPYTKQNTNISHHKSFYISSTSKLYNSITYKHPQPMAATLSSKTEAELAAREILKQANADEEEARYAKEYRKREERLRGSVLSYESDGKGNGVGSESEDDGLEIKGGGKGKGEGEGRGDGTEGNGEAEGEKKMYESEAPAVEIQERLRFPYPPYSTATRR